MKLPSKGYVWLQCLIWTGQNGITRDMGVVWSTRVMMQSQPLISHMSAMKGHKAKCRIPLPYHAWQSLWSRHWKLEFQAAGELTGDLIGLEGGAWGFSHSCSYSFPRCSPDSGFTLESLPAVLTSMYTDLHWHFYYKPHNTTGQPATILQTIVHMVL